MGNEINWEKFQYVHPDARTSFEQLCRILFKRQFFDDTFTFRSDPNHPGIEISPIYSPKTGKKISFQSKYFKNRIDYKQIQHSVDEAVKYYQGELETFYLYCNYNLKSTSEGYKKINSTLSDAGIKLEVISGDEIITQVMQFTDLQLFFFEKHNIAREWFQDYNQLSFESLGERYNPRFNIETEAKRKLDLFTKNQESLSAINDKKLELISDLQGLFNFRYSTLIDKIQNFIATLDDINADNLTSYFSWNSEIKEYLSKDIENLMDKRGRLNNELESNENLDTESKNKIYYKVRDIDYVLDLIDHFGCSDEEKKLLTDKVLFVTGEAGMGKSQLFATETKEIFDNDGYALLLLGHHYLQGNDISSQIIERFNLKYGFSDFLQILDTLGDNENKDIHIFIDAINETPEKRVWKNGISRLISEIKKRKHIKLIFSIRSGYEEPVLEDSVKKKISDGSILRLIHYGFRDESVTATKEFLNYHNIPFSPSDLLSYEMINPLFLTLFCKTYTGEEMNIFQMFERLITIVDEEIKDQLGFSGVSKIIEDLLLEISKFQLENDRNYITKKELLKLEFWMDYGILDKKVTIITALNQSSILNSFILKGEEVYSFGYNLFEDYIKAKSIINSFPEKKELEIYLNERLLNIEDGKIENFHNIDIFVFVCYFCSEKFSDDCIGIIENLTDENDQYHLANRYIKSYSWRPYQTINIEVFKQVVNNYPINHNEIFMVLIENSTKDNNPLNAEFLHKILFGKKLNERDSFWLPFVNHLISEEDRIFQLVSLFDSGERFENLSKNKIKLLLVLFTWLLASSNRRLRDITSKAMIELLKDNFELCEYILRKFENINDPYIIQRLYGVVFGACVKRTNCFDEEFRSLFDFVYASIFDKEFVYPDILLRDYARLIIERYLFEFSLDKEKIEYSKVIPPYKSLEIPKVTFEEYNDPSIKKDGFNGINISMKPEGVGMYGDFGRYTFQSALNDFEDTDIENLYHYAMQYIRDELGYSNELFSEYDTSRVFTLDRSRNSSIERIGKKYQWIAFYHILARVSDNSKVRSWGDTPDQDYNGAWEPYVRDFDPTMNYHFMKPSDGLPKFEVSPNEDFIEDIAGLDVQIQEWARNKAHLFDEPLSYKDKDGIEWMLLYQHKEIKYENDSSYESGLGFPEGSQRIRRIVQAYFVSNNEFDKLKENLQTKRFWGRNFPEGRSSLYQIFNREFAWSPSIDDILGDYWCDYEVETGEEIIERISVPDVIFIGDSFEDEQIIFQEKEIERVIKPKRLLAKVLPAHVHYLWEEEYDYSKKEAISFDIPCPAIVEKLNLRQEEYDGYYYSPSGDLIAFDGEITKTINGLVIRKDYLETFLIQNNLRMFWTCLGEKQYFKNKPDGQIYSEWDGLYWLNEQLEVKGEITRNSENPN
ncbi:hypothetical protein IYQ92_01050 [Streptococcus sp. HF-1907]|uniref:hypothetical protein n=1 Tax=Streptococcus sp. HF-1907 TaxID=2785793 RepID=UPI00189EFD3B|nr:hypothetical protein [Streptococcus sp. HF-1907]MBF7093884.1 hypothetical protein [Streptococcus sp. HF-1907]